MKCLKVSYDCGITYSHDMCIVNEGDMQTALKRAGEFDQSMLRWIIEDDETGEIDKEHLCSIHKDIVRVMNILNNKQED